MGASYMKIVNSFEEIPALPAPIAFSLGTYDGVHLGHQALFQELKKRGTAVVLTFTNHPLEVLNPEVAPPLIDTLEQRLRRMESHGIDLVIAIPFTPDLAALPYDTFIQKIRAHLPFHSLVLGEGDAFGYKRLGNEHNLRILGKQLGFEVIFLPKTIHTGETVSSRRIRELIENHEFEQAFELLGRPKGLKIW
jgi:riboflavin kinase/FMN adenylyltransferase